MKVLSSTTNPKKLHFATTTQIFVGKMLCNHLVSMPPSLGPQGILPRYNKTGRSNLGTSNSNTWCISETKVSEHNNVSYWDKAMVRSLRFPARHHTILEYSADIRNRMPHARVSFHIQKPMLQASIKNKMPEFHKLFDNYNKILKRCWEMGSCYGNVTAATKKTNNPELIVHSYFR